KEDGQKGRQEEGREKRRQEVRQDGQVRQDEQVRQDGQVGKDGQEVTRSGMKARQGSPLPFSFMRLLFALILAASPALGQQMPVVQLSAGMHLIRAEVAGDYATRMTGL